MMRLAPILLAMMMITQAFYNLGVIGYWYANQAYIAANLCVNINRPELHCNGKCYLEKKIAGIPGPFEGGFGALPKLKKGNDLTEFLALASVLSETPANTIAVSIPIPASRHHGIAPVSRIFHPPSFCA